MKTTISLIVCVVAFVLYCCSCKKNTDTKPTSDTTSSKKVMVTLHPGGEFTVDQSARQENSRVTGKTIRDSTYYSVEITNGSARYALGIFDNPDSIHFLLDPAYTYKIRLVVLQKGTGHGFYYEYYEWGWTYGNPQDDGKPSIPLVASCRTIWTTPPTFQTTLMDLKEWAPIIRFLPVIAPARSLPRP